MPKSWPNLSGVFGIAGSSFHVEEPVGSVARFFRFKIFAKTTYKVTGLTLDDLDGYAVFDQFHNFGKPRLKLPNMHRQGHSHLILIQVEPNLTGCQVILFFIEN
jgi:hypothetical protein